MVNCPAFTSSTSSSGYFIRRSMVPFPIESQSESFSICPALKFWQMLSCKLNLVHQ
jgi:hypothetical protein